jgi:hypothetical protein
LRLVEFFTAQIRNPNTRATYGTAMRDFFTWLEMRDGRARQQAAAAALLRCQMIGTTAHLPERDLRLEYERRADPLRLR